MSKQWRRWLAGAESLLFPPRSLATGEQLPGPGQLEPELWARLTFTSPPICFQCGQELDPALEPDHLAEQNCAACIASPPRFDHARAALIYDDASRDIILRFKHGGERSGLDLLASWMIRAAPDMVAACDIVTPVPLHYRRLLSRGFNQSLYLAAAIARRAKKTLSAHGVKRMRATPSQAGRSATARQRNVQGAFALSYLDRNRFRDKRVLLVDDVFTTGATVEACASVLKRKGGAAQVDVMTLARVARPVDATI